jgi:hypothetical protein
LKHKTSGLTPIAIQSLTAATRIAIGALLLAGLAGCSGAQDQKKFVAERRAEAAGYRLEHFERERLLFVHHPDGEKDGVDLATLQRVFLRRQSARDSVDGKARYFWDFGGPQRVVSAPFFSAESSAVIRILDGELAGFDDVAAARMSAVFERNEASLCFLWASAEYLKETRAKKEEECRP